MRNLKKILALVLALAMSLSLVTIASGADFNDADEITLTEAVDVMTAIGVFEGHNTGDFAPQGTLTREQAAKIITYMLLGENADRLSVSSTSFSDVSADRWSAAAIEYCTTLGIIAGNGDGTFNPRGNLTGYAFAKMLLTALGYDASAEGLTGTGWTINVSRLALQVGLDNGIENLTWGSSITREQAAQMALNAIKSPLVVYDSGSTIIINGEQVSFGSGQANYVTTTLAREQRISDATLSNTNDIYTVEFGERYFPLLVLNDDEVDAFGRPSYTWSYNTIDIGTYVDEDLLVAEYTESVDGGDVFADIGSVVADYPLDYYEDGVLYGRTETKAVSDELVRNGGHIGHTGRGVLTQVFVDQENSELTIVEIHTYLAQAANDYSETSGRLTINIYTGKTVSGGVSEELVTSRRLEDDDLPEIANYEEGEFMLVTMADGVVETIADPEVVSDATITAYSSSAWDGEDTETAGAETRVSSVTSNGTKYDVAYEAYYDAAYLFDYHTDRQQMYEHTYNLLLDPYGNVIGLENVTDNTNSFFIVGYTQRSVNWGNAIDTAYVIFPDGRMEEVQAMERTGVTVDDKANVNAWYDYSINEDGVYEIHGLTANQFVNSSDDYIDSSHDTLDANATNGGTTTRNYAYGGDDSVYITVETGTVNSTAVIEKVNNVTTGLRNTNITIDDSVAVSSDLYSGYWGYVFGLYDSHGYVTYAIVIGEGGNDDFVYLASGITGAEQRGSVTYYSYDAILPGSDEVTTVWTKNLTTAAYDSNGDGTLDSTAQLAAHNLYEATYDADGNITAMDVVDDTASTAFNTDAYESAGYAMLTVNAGAGTPAPSQEFIESGRTLRFPNADDNNNYILLAPDCLFFVNGEDDGNGDYEVYSSMSAALTALGTNAAGQHLLTASASTDAKFVAFTNSNGQATAIIFYDRAYEDVSTPGGGSGRDTFAITQSGTTITATYTDYPSFVGGGASVNVKYRALGETAWANLGVAIYNGPSSSTSSSTVKTYVYDYTVSLTGNYEVYAEFVQNGEVLAESNIVTIYG